jgi:hypothetical protein
MEIEWGMVLIQPCIQALSDAIFGLQVVDISIGESPPLDYYPYLQNSLGGTHINRVYIIVRGTCMHDIEFAISP